MADDGKIEMYRTEFNEKKDDLTKYGWCIWDIKNKLKVIKTYSDLDPRPFDHFIETEFICLQFRQIFESLILANLVANKDEYNAAHKQIEYQWSPRRIIPQVKGLNPEYYPKPVIFHANGNIENYLGADYLTESDLLAADDLCSQFLHAENPFGQRRNINVVRNQFNEWYSKIKQLLESHVVTLAKVGRMIFVRAYFDTNIDPLAIYAGQA
jgi:hypothetical protein